MTFQYNGRSDCAVCNLTGLYITCNGVYLYPGATSFTDPTPPGAVVTQIKLSGYGLLHPADSNAHMIDFTLNNSTVSIMPLNIPAGTYEGCGAPTCDYFESATLEYEQGVPDYGYGNTNSIGWTGCTSNYLVMTQLNLAIVYTL